MPERMWSCSLGDASLARRVGDGFLDDRLMEVKPCRWSPSRISTNPRGGKHELPSPFGSGVGVLAVQCEWQHDATKASRGVAEMLLSDTIEMARWRLDDSKPQPRTVKKSEDHPGDTIEALHDARDLVAAEDNRHTSRHASARHVFDRADVDVQHLAIQKQHGAERLILCRGNDTSICREPGQTFADFRRALAVPRLNGGAGHDGTPSMTWHRQCEGVNNGTLRKDLPRIQNPVGIEGRLQTLHQRNLFRR